uniref:Nucleoside diphosphate kinase B n=1 Tax=Periophthalmus magnuspinnatus TaxID=409849 RepID=A0A3B4B3L7_9GOBI
QREVTLTEEQVRQFYAQKVDESFFPALLQTMTSGPCLLLVLFKENAVEEWRVLMGPTEPDRAKEMSPESLRARFGSDILHNAVHGSSSVEQAVREIQLVFGGLQPWVSYTSAVRRNEPKLLL